MFLYSLSTTVATWLCKISTKQARSRYLPTTYTKFKQACTMEIEGLFMISAIVDIVFFISYLRLCGRSQIVSFQITTIRQPYLFCFSFLLSRKLSCKNHKISVFVLQQLSDKNIIPTLNCSLSLAGLFCSDSAVWIMQQSLFYYFWSPSLASICMNLLPLLA